MPDLRARVREIISRPIAELVALGLQGGEKAAIMLLAIQYTNKLALADDYEALRRLREQIDEQIDDEAEDVDPPPVLRLVQQ